jgi:hypothetical protein
MSRKSGALTYLIPMGLFRPVVGQLYFTVLKYLKISHISYVACVSAQGMLFHIQSSNGIFVQFRIGSL